MNLETFTNRPLSAMICPVCAATFQLSAEGTAGVLCEEGHRFDFSRHCYLNLLSGTASKFTPDTAQMVRARSVFLAAGHFEPLNQELNRIYAEFLPTPAAAPLLVDAGCGTGHYLAGLRAGSAAGYSAIGLDLSPEALRQAVRANPELLALVWDLWRPLPLAAGCADAILVVFAPRNMPEFQRILRPNGILTVVTPLPEHLSGLPQVEGSLGQQPGKQQALSAAAEGHFETVSETEIRSTATLTGEAAKQLISMGPAGHHVSAAALQTLDQDAYQVRFGFRVSVFKPIPASTAAPVLRLPLR